VVRYAAGHAAAGEPVEKSFTVERRTGFVATVLLHPWLSAAIVLLILVAVARTRTARQRARATSNAE